MALLVFAISYLLPAYGDFSGFACFTVCWQMLLGNDTPVLSGGWFYYSGFVICNVIFIALAVALFVTRNNRPLRLGISVVLFLHVLSWLILHVFQQPPQIADLKVGYYLWLIAFGLLLVAHFRPVDSRLAPTTALSQPDES